MDTSASKLHPLVATAAVAVIAFAGTGIAAFTGVLPASNSSPVAAALQPAALAPSMPVPPKPALQKAVVRVAQQPAYPTYEPYHEPRARRVAQRRDYAVVESVRALDTPGPGTGIGAAAGGVAGGVAGAMIGKHIGKGSGQAIAAILGAAGGAYAGHQIEKKVRTTKSYETTVRLGDGSSRVLTQASEPAWRPGDRVRIANGVITHV